MGKILQGKLTKYLSLGLFFALDICLLLFVAYHLAYQDRIYPGIFIAGQSVGNQTPPAASQILKKALPETNRLILTFSPSNQAWPFNLAEFGFSYQEEQTVRTAYQIGRSGNFSKDLAVKTQAWQKGINLKMDYTLNQPLLEEKIATISAQLFVPAVEPSIKVVNQQVQVEPGEPGREVDLPKLLSTINYQLSRPRLDSPVSPSARRGRAVEDGSTINFGPIELPIITTFPVLTPKQVETTRQRAEKLLGKKLTLTQDDRQWTLEQEELIQFLSFTNGFDQEKIASWSADLESTINRPAENAAFQYLQGRVSEFRPAKEGKTLEKEKTIDLITQSLDELEEGKEEITLSLPVITTPPAVKTADVNDLGIKQLVGRGFSYFRGSASSRIHNIQLASSKFNGYLLPPNETFSFNQTLGEVSKDTGYQEAYIIKEGRTVLGDGGGVCQVSTTLFRAALKAGLPIVERQAHAYRVYYYEQNSPVGLDATVFDPTADLKIRNDTPAYLLLQTKVDLKNQQLTFELYGTADGRRATISPSRIWDQVPPPPDLYQDDPTLPVGTIKQIDWKAWGAKVAFDYKVERNGEILQNRTFYSAYRPWQAVYLRGTKPN